MPNKLFVNILFFVILGAILYLYKPFLMALSIAILLSIATSKFQHFFLEKTRSNTLSSTFSTIILALLFFAPIFYAFSNLAIYIVNLDKELLENMVNFVKSQEGYMNEYFSFLQPHLREYLQEIDTALLATKALGFASSFLKASAGFVKDMILILIFYFFITYYAKEMLSYLKTVLPMKAEETALVSSEITNVMSVVYFSILVTAMFEGALFAVLGLTYGYDALLIGILYGFASLIPVIGGIIMWLPLSIYEATQGNYTTAIVVAIYSIVVISLIADTFIKPLIIKYINEKLMDSPTKINELLIFFSIIAGLSSFGFWGMIFGPAITTIFLSVLTLIAKLNKSDVT